jgi:hypothetical protein
MSSSVVWIVAAVLVGWSIASVIGAVIFALALTSWKEGRPTLRVLARAPTRQRLVHTTETNPATAGAAPRSAHRR